MRNARGVEAGPLVAHPDHERPLLSYPQLHLDASAGVGTTPVADGVDQGFPRGEPQVHGFVGSEAVRGREAHDQLLQQIDVLHATRHVDSQIGGTNRPAGGRRVRHEKRPPSGRTSRIPPRFAPGRRAVTVVTVRTRAGLPFLEEAGNLAVCCVMSSNPSLSAPRSPFPAGTRFGPFEVLCPLGVGGMSASYPAHPARPRPRAPPPPPPPHPPPRPHHP